MATTLQPLWSLHRNEGQKGRRAGLLSVCRKKAPTFPRDVAPPSGLTHNSAPSDARAHTYTHCSELGQDSDQVSSTFSSFFFFNDSSPAGTGTSLLRCTTFSSDGTSMKVLLLPPSALVDRHLPSSNMPERISISDFVVLTNEDLSSPGTSSFQSRMSDCRNTVSTVEEVSACARVRVSSHLSTTCLLSRNFFFSIVSR